MILEAQIEPTELIRADSQFFRLEAKIKGLPYVFSGNIPQEPGTTIWNVKLPSEDKNVTPISAGTIHAEPTLAREDGDITLEYIGSLTDLIEHPPYKNADGVGSFLLANFLTLADLRGWRIYLYPYWAGGRGSFGQILDWYAKHGFNNGKRQPQKPDKKQVIATMVWQ